MFWTFSFIFFIPLSQQLYCGIASHFGKKSLFWCHIFLSGWSFKVFIFGRGGRSCWTWQWIMPGRDSGARPGWNCGSSSLLLISQSFFILWWEGTGDRIIDFCQKFQDFHFAGFSMGSLGPHRNYVMWRIVVGNLTVLQVPSLTSLMLVSNITI